MQPRVTANASKSIFKHVQKRSELQGQQTAPVHPEATAVLARAGTLRAPASSSNAGVGLRSPRIDIWFGRIWLASRKLNLPLEKTDIRTELEQCLLLWHVILSPCSFHQLLMDCIGSKIKCSLSLVSNLGYLKCLCVHIYIFVYIYM